MLISDFYNEFLEGYDNKDLVVANTALMKELGNIMVTHKNDFADLLEESNINATADMDEPTLINLFIDNIDSNKNLQLGSSMLVNHHNQQIGFDGDSEISDEGVKAAYHTISIYFSKPSENYANAGGIAEAIAESAKLGGKIAEGQQKKKYGALDMATKKQDAKVAMTQQILAQKQAQIEAKTKEKEIRAKTTKTVLIVGGALFAVALVGGIIYFLKKKSK